MKKLRRTDTGTSSLKSLVRSTLATLGHTPKTTSLNLFSLPGKDTLHQLSDEEIIQVCANLERQRGTWDSTRVAGNASSPGKATPQKNRHIKSGVRHPEKYWRYQFNEVVRRGGRQHLIDWLEHIYDSHYYAQEKGLGNLQDYAAWLQSRVNAFKATVRGKQ